VAVLGRDYFDAVHRWPLPYWLIKRLKVIDNVSCRIGKNLMIYVLGS